MAVFDEYLTHAEAHRWILEADVGDPNDLRLGMLGRNDEAREGQTIVTAGTTSPRLRDAFRSPRKTSRRGSAEPSRARSATAWKFR